MKTLNIFIISILFFIVVNGYTQPLIDSLFQRINQLEQQEKYEEALNLINEKEHLYIGKWFQLSKEKIYLNEKLEYYKENLRIFKEGHQKGYFYLIHPQLPKYKPYLELDSFDSIAKKDMQLRTAAMENSKIDYQVILPSAYDKTNKYPLILILHGGGSNFDKVMKHWKSNLLSEKYIQVFLQSYRFYDSETYGWKTDDPRAEKEIDSIYQELLINYSVDTTQLIMAGISAGGSYSIDFALRKILPVKGVLAFCPGKPASINFSTFSTTNVHKPKFYFVGGELDFYLEKQKQLCQIFDSVGIIYHHEIIEKMEHAYPTNEELWIEKGINFINTNH